MKYLNRSSLDTNSVIGRIRKKTGRIVADTKAVKRVFLKSKDIAQNRHAEKRRRPRWKTAKMTLGL